MDRIKLAGSAKIAIQRQIDRRTESANSKIDDQPARVSQHGSRLCFFFFFLCAAVLLKICQEKAPPSKPETRLANRPAVRQANRLTKRQTGSFFLAAQAIACFSNDFRVPQTNRNEASKITSNAIIYNQMLRNVAVHSIC